MNSSLNQENKVTLRDNSINPRPFHRPVFTQTLCIYLQYSFTEKSNNKVIKSGKKFSKFSKMSKFLAEVYPYLVLIVILCILFYVWFKLTL